MNLFTLICNCLCRCSGKITMLCHANMPKISPMRRCYLVHLTNKFLFSLWLTLKWRNQGLRLGVLNPVDVFLFNFFLSVWKFPPNCFFSGTQGPVSISMTNCPTHHPPMLFVHCRMVRRPVGHLSCLLKHPLTPVEFFFSFKIPTDLPFLGPWTPLEVLLLVSFKILMDLTPPPPQEFLDPPLHLWDFACDWLNLIFFFSFFLSYPKFPKVHWPITHMMFISFSPEQTQNLSHLRFLLSGVGQSKTFITLVERQPSCTHIRIKWLMGIKYF